MDTDTGTEIKISPRKLWFGCITTAVSWAGMGCLDILITWRACQHQENFGLAGAHPYIRLLYSLFAVALLIISIWSGVISYRNWHRLSAQKDFLQALGVERQEFMAVLGVIMTVTLGMGLVWFAIPPIFLDICWRAR